MDSAIALTDRPHPMLRAVRPLLLLVEVVAAAMLVADIAVVVGSVLGRTFLSAPLTWSTGARKVCRKLRSPGSPSTPPKAARKARMTSGPNIDHGLSCGSPPCPCVSGAWTAACGAACAVLASASPFDASA